MDNYLKLETPWADVKELLKEVHPDLTDEDLEYSPGEEEALLQRLALKMNRTPAHVRAWIESVSYNDGKAS